MSKPERNIINFEDILAREGKCNVLFFNYDNEAFMNTGIQESGATPPYASMFSPGIKFTSQIVSFF